MHENKNAHQNRFQLIVNPIKGVRDKYELK